MSETVVDWLRAEVAADRAEIASMSAADVGQAALDAVLTPGLVVRTAVHSCAYAINHGKLGAETTFSLFERPIRADWWRHRDDVQASLLSALCVGWLATPYASLPTEPVLAAVVTLQALPLVVDPLQAIAGVWR